MARSTLSLFMLAAKALSMARRRRGLEVGSPPPRRAATVISRMILVKILPRLASCLPLRCWMLAHLLCPAMVEPSVHVVKTADDSTTAGRPDGPAALLHHHHAQGVDAELALRRLRGNVRMAVFLV